MQECAICQAELEQSKTGRPKQYCSTGCRRMAEREIKRLEKRIAELEGDLMRFRCLKPDEMLCGGKAVDVIARHEAELKRQNDRFRLLLSGPEETE